MQAVTAVSGRTASRGKTIRQFLIDGSADGRWVSELSNWTGKAYKIPRTYINSCEDRDDLHYTGVYFLFGIDDDTDEPQVYIGEAENIINRIKQHLSDKDFWTECVVFISKDNNLNKAHIKYLENHLYLLAKENKRYTVMNANTPTEPSISEMDRAEMDEFINNMQLILNVLGHKVLEPAAKPHKRDTARRFSLTYHNKTVATGGPVPQGFAVFKGSSMVSETTPSLPPSICNERQQLIDKGIVVDGKFVQDWPFSSPSRAASVVLGYKISGPIAWKDKNSVTLKDAEIENRN